MINYWNNGKPANGKYVILNAYKHWLEVGEQRRSPNAFQGMQYKGRRMSRSGIQEFDWGEQERQDD